jgi:photosystem II stability/assembly factor-like uncharacterized protein
MNENAIPGAPDEFVRVFVSYAREDRRWLDPDYRFSLIPFLMESLRRHKVAFWFDKELKPGDEFRRFIESQIDQSQIALLIVSQSFLNSEFIENREMPRIAERARLGQMIVVPVLVEPCDWSEYPFLADRQMVPSSPLIEYTESEPQWVKVRYQILDGLKAQLKRISEAPQAHASSAAVLNAHPAPLEETVIEAGAISSSQPGPRQQDEQPEEELNRVAREGEEREAAEQGTLRAGIEAEQIRQQRAREAETKAGETKTGDDAANHLFIAGKKVRRGVVAAFAIALCIGIVCFGVYAYHRWIAPSGSTNSSQAQTGSGSTSGTVWTARNSGTTEVLISILGLSDGKHLCAIGQTGEISESDDGGASWTVHNSGATGLLYSATRIGDGQHLWIVGNSGVILESDDGGSTWTARSSGTTNWLGSITGTSDGKRLWAIGGGGTIVESADGGATWIARISWTTNGLASIFGASDGRELWIVGAHGTILQSGDGGTTWVARDSGTTQELTSIFGTSDGKRLWTVGYAGKILESDDGGASWTARSSGTIYTLEWIFGTSDGKHLWVVGQNGTILESDYGGATWTARNSGTTNNLWSIFGTSDGQHLWAVGDHGTILESDH